MNSQTFIEWLSWAGTVCSCRGLWELYMLIRLISAPLTNIWKAWLGKKGISYLPFPTPDGPRRTCRSLLLKWGHGCLPLRLHSTRTFCHLHPGLTFIWDKHPNWGTTSPPFFYVEHQGLLPFLRIQNQQACFSHSPVVSCPCLFPNWPKPRPLLPLALWRFHFTNSYFLGAFENSYPQLACSRHGWSHPNSPVGSPPWVLLLALLSDLG